jgi:hypothetical protein
MRESVATLKETESTSKNCSKLAFIARSEAVSGLSRDFFLLARTLVVRQAYFDGVFQMILNFEFWKITNPSSQYWLKP